MQVAHWLFGATIKAPAIHERKAESWLHTLCHYGFNPYHIHVYQRGVEKLNLPANHPLSIKIQRVLSDHPFLKNHLQPEDTQASLPIELPFISGDVLDVNNPLSAIKLMIEKEGRKFKEIIVRDFDDELIALIVKNCPLLESLILSTGYIPCISFTDKGLESIAILAHLKKLHIRSPLSVDVTFEGVTKLFKTPELQKNLIELNLSLDLNDKALSVIAECRSLTSLALQCYSLTSKDLRSFFLSSYFKATLEILKVDIFSLHYDDKFTIDDLILEALSDFKHLKCIDLGSAWKVTDPVLCKFLEAHKDAANLTLRNLPIGEDVEAKIGDLSHLTRLNLSDCSNLWSYNFLNNTSLVAHLNLSKAFYLFHESVEKISRLPQLTSLDLSMERELGGFDKFCRSSNMQNQLKVIHLYNTNVDSNSLGHVIHLKALTVLRVENCSGFNDDVMQSISNSSLQTRLTTLQLKDVYITGKSLDYLAKMAGMTGLLLANLYAMTQDDRERFFDLPNVQNNVTNLLLNQFPFPETVVDKLKMFSNLKRLGIININLDPDHFYALQKNAAIPLDLIFWLGPDNNGILYRFFDGEPF